MTQELNRFPRIVLAQDKEGYGGSQKWFRDPWRRLSGCAAVSAVNLAAYYRIGMTPDLAEGEEALFSEAYYRKKMNRMFREHMKTGRYGFPNPDRYIEEFTAYAKKEGVLLRADRLYAWGTAKEALAFVAEHIREGHPVVMLILNHSEAALADLTWHWMTITGCGEASNRLILSNYGERQLWDAAAILTPGRGNEVFLISFREEAAEEEPERRSC